MGKRSSRISYQKQRKESGEFAVIGPRFVIVRAAKIASEALFQIGSNCTDSFDQHDKQKTDSGIFHFLAPWIEEATRFLYSSYTCGTKEN